MQQLNIFKLKLISSFCEQITKATAWVFDIETLYQLIKMNIHTEESTTMTTGKHQRPLIRVLQQWQSFST